MKAMENFITNKAIAKLFVLHTECMVVHISHLKISSNKVLVNICKVY